jgi:hypothetical protein
MNKKIGKIPGGIHETLRRLFWCVFVFGILLLGCGSHRPHPTGVQTTLSDSSSTTVSGGEMTSPTTSTSKQPHRLPYLLALPTQHRRKKWELCFFETNGGSPIEPSRGSRRIRHRSPEEPERPGTAFGVGMPMRN